MSVSINGTSGLVFNDGSSQNTGATGFGFKNRIINGDMRIDQRNAGASVTPATGGIFSVDRFRAGLSQASKYSVQQNAGSVTPPAGFTNYLGVTSLSAYSVSAGDYFSINQSIEGYNIADLNFGSANAKTVTLSFWVRSSLTGTFGGAVQNGANDRSYPYSYTINTANTWEQKSITIVGDATGTWLTTNGAGLVLRFALGYGSTYGSGTAGAWVSGDVQSVTGATSVVGNNGATFYITGVQLEKGSTATSFDYRPYGTELALCQRYYQTGRMNCFTFITSGGSASQVYNNYATLRVSMRAAPTVTPYRYDKTVITNGTYVSRTTNESDYSGLINSSPYLIPSEPDSIFIYLTTSNTWSSIPVYYICSAEL